MKELRRILIVGGSIADLSAAIALDPRGFEVELVERQECRPTVGAAIVLHANAVRALRRLGLGEHLDQASAPTPHWSFLDREGGGLRQKDLQDLWGDVGSDGSGP
jgi:2-polyprenyl-6-methoxyphenol hydroxylase-like FAD-dependent oxidoreductase